jgi:FtsH-binding integral membrane protein
LAVAPEALDRYHPQPFYEEEQMDSWSSATPVTSTRTGEFMAAVYRWMAFGLALTGMVAWAVTNSPGILSAFYVIQDGRIAGSTGLMWITIIAWFVIGLAFTPVAMRASIGIAVGMFLTYCALTGLVFSSVLLQYTGASVASTLFVTAGSFFGLSLYGTMTKRDLSGMRSFLFIGLIGIILAGIVNIFLRNSAVEFVISCAGVLIFAGLTAYDTQKLRALAQTGEERHALIGALALYLDFINLFLFLLRFMGRRRND